MAYIYPHIDNADDVLRELSLAGIERKYTDSLKEKALSVIEEELEYVKRQGSASGYIVTVNALNAVAAVNEEFALRGTSASSLLSYALGLSDIEPLESEPKLYSEFYYGIHGDKLPSFEMTVSEDLQNRLLEYFDNYPGEEPIRRRYDSRDQFIGVYIGEIVEEKIGDETFIDTFYINFTAIEDEEKFHDGLMSDYVIDACHPKSLSDYVKCFGFKHGTGVWEDNAEILVREKQVPFDELIANREDVYEYLLNKGIDRNMAYEIAEYVRKGRTYKRGWAEEMREAMDKAGVEKWFIDSCEKIRYLFPRAHAMMLFKRYCKEI